MKENIATTSKVTGTFVSDFQNFSLKQYKRNGKSKCLCFIFNSPDIVQGFTFVILLASLGVYIKLGSASLFQLPTPWAYLAAKRFEKY